MENTAGGDGMGLMHTLAGLAGDLGCILALLALLIRPVRERLFSDRNAREGQKCLLRMELVELYYGNLTRKQLREYEFECMELCYRAYKALGGNSFIDHIHEEMKEWTVVR